MLIAFIGLILRQLSQLKFLPWVTPFAVEFLLQYLDVY